MGDGYDIINETYLAWTEERGLLQSFIQEASGILTLPPTDLVHWAEYAQHYGVPTRFLDWTSNPLTALYFTCRDKTNCDGSVWLLHKINYSNFIGEHLHIPKDKKIQEIIMDLLQEKSDVEFPITYTPYYVDSRMNAQSSYFMVWGTKKEALENLLKDECYEMKLPETNDGERTYGIEQEQAILFKFHVYAACKQPLLHELDMVGINEKTLFPGLDGIGKYVERKYRFDYNEAMGSL